MFGIQIGDAWLDSLYGRAESEAKAEPTKLPPLPIWLPDIEKALKERRIRDPYEEALKIARGE